VWLKISRCELGKLEKCWKVVKQEASQGECNIKQMQSDVEML
jgi:hypothetical protein